MAQARVCDKCGKIMSYASDTKIKIYVHPYGDVEYELCSKCTKKLQKWLNSKNQLSVEIEED